MLVNYFKYLFLGFFVLWGSGDLLHAEPPYERIISLCPAITSNLNQLDAMNQVSGVTTYATVPHAKPIIGQLNKFNLEKIVSLKPDLILGFSELNQCPDLDRLKQLGYAVHLFPPVRTWEDVLSVFITCAKLTGREDFAQTLITQWNAERLAIQNKTTQSYSVFCQIDFIPLITAGSGSYLTNLLSDLKLHNIFSDQSLNYLRVNTEQVIARFPDIIIYFTMTPDPLLNKRIDQFWSRFSSLPAIRNHQTWHASDPCFTLPTPMSYLQSLTLLEKNLLGLSS